METTDQYRWTFPFGLWLQWQAKAYIVRAVEEAQELLGPAKACPNLPLVEERLTEPGYPKPKANWQKTKTGRKSTRR